MRPPPRIARDVGQHVRRPDPRRARKHLDFIRSLGVCLCCGAVGRVEAAHVRKGTDHAGMGTKPADRYSVPLAHECHARQHRIGELTFWSETGIDPVDVALRLWTVSGNEEAGARTILRARQGAAMKGARP